METTLLEKQLAKQPLEEIRNILQRDKLTDNIILNCDTYKCGHWMFMEDNTEYTMAYLECRAGSEFDITTMFGLQMHLFMEDYIKPVTANMVDQADAVLKQHGVPLNREGWDYIVNTHDGYMPIRINAVPEGKAVPVGNILIKIESTDPKFNAAWAAMWIETKLMRTWYPITVATQSRLIKDTITEGLEISGTPAIASMKMIDFGSRGVTSKEQAQIGGAANLVFFEGTDNLMGMAAIMDYYMVEDDGVPAYSIPATEHTETILWGRHRERDFYENIVKNVLPKTGICSIVIDTYDALRAIEMLGEFRKEIEAAGVIVFRPDSGAPVDMTEQVIRKIDEVFGSDINDKGFKVLNPCARMLQGDGIDLDMVKQIIDNFIKIGYSIDNITFGSGGGLLQKMNRDTLRVAIKGSHGVIDGDARDIRKVPSTDMTKASKEGILRLVENSKGDIRTINQHVVAEPDEVDLLEVVFENGQILKWQSIEEIRKLAAE